MIGDAVRDIRVIHFGLPYARCCQPNLEFVLNDRFGRPASHIVR
jgi:hypothetical protein